MAKKSSAKKSNRSPAPPPNNAGTPSSSDDVDEEQRLTLDALEEISSDEEDDGGGGGGGVIGKDDDDGEEEWDAEADALRRAIAEGAFDGLKLEGKERRKRGSRGKKESTDIEATTRNSDEADAEEETWAGVVGDGSASDEGESAFDDDDDDDDDDDGTSDEEADERAHKRRMAASGSRALLIVTEEIEAARLSLPWAERFDVVPSAPLPFDDGGRDEEDEDDEETEPADVHDDLKREVAFYNLALEAVRTAKVECRDANIPFSRPDDFFAEMIKTDGKFERSAPDIIPNICRSRFL